MEDYQLQVVEKIKELCAERHWTFYRLSLESGISHSALHNMLNRCTVPTVPSIQKLCDAFGITISQFFATANDICTLSEDETNLLKTFRCLSKEDKHSIESYAAWLAQREKK